MSGDPMWPDAVNVFEKKFDFYKPTNDARPWSIPRPRVEGGRASAFKPHPLKKNLNELKNSLNDYDITKWHKHTTDANPAGRVMSEVRRLFHPELCTQAWCKFHELLCFGNVIPDHAVTTKKLNSVHLCEAPGAFVCSLNHFLKSHYHKVKFKWLASTLNPYYEGNDPNFCIADDRLIFKTLASWCFGNDDTGDIFSRSTLDKMLACVKDMRIVHLVTADGSINCQLDPENQEKDTLPLKYAELFYALHLLSPGGSFVLKTFTLFEFGSVALLYILWCFFESVSVHKPATSKPGNSEVYVIARNFHGKDVDVDFLKLLDQRFPFANEADMDLLSPHDLPPEFLRQHEECVSLFTRLQMDTIVFNKQTYGTKQLCAEYEEYKQHVCETAMYLMGLRKIYKNQGLLPCGTLQHKVVSHVKLRPKLTGSYAERHMDRKDQQCQTRVHHKVDRDTLIWRNCEETAAPTNVFVYGKRVDEIKSSLFCDTDILMAATKRLTGASGKQADVASAAISKMVAEKLSESAVGSGSHHNIFVLDFFSTDYWKHLTSLLPSGVHVQYLKTADIQLSSISSCGLILCNLVPDREDVSRELIVRRGLLDVVSLVSKSLPIGASFGCFLPSLLTRFSVGLMWIICRMFDRHTLTATKVPTDRCGVIVLFSGRRLCESWSAYIQELNCAFGDAGVDSSLLEVVPTASLIADQEFMRMLKVANHNLLQ